MGLLEAVGAALLAVVAAFLVGRRRGAQATVTKNREMDRDRADEIEDAADRARRADDAGGGDAADRLSRAGRLRD